MVRNGHCRRISLKSKSLKAVKMPIHATVQKLVIYLSDVKRPYTIFFVSVDCDYDLYHKVVSNIYTTSWLSGSILYLLSNNNVCGLPSANVDDHMVVFNHCDDFPLDFAHLIWTINTSCWYVSHMPRMVRPSESWARCV